MDNVKKQDEKVVYIAGSITHNPGYHKQFKYYEDYLKRMVQGTRVLNPVTMCENAGVREYNSCMQITIVAIVTGPVDILVVIDGWENSRGAKLEVELAKIWEKPVLTVSQYVGLFS